MKIAHMGKGALLYVQPRWVQVDSTTTTTSASIAQQFAPKSNVIDMAHRSRERGEKKPGDQDI